MSVSLVIKVLSENTTHAKSLAAGLQLAAPAQGAVIANQSSLPTSSEGQSNSVQYLLEISGKMTDEINKLEQLFPSAGSQNSFRQV